MVKIDEPLIQFGLGVVGGLVIDKIAEYAYVTSGMYEASGRKSYDDLALNLAGIGLTAYKKNLGLGFLTGVQAGLFLSLQDISLVGMGSTPLHVPTRPIGRLSKYVVTG